eukprot:scaffold44867_cov19-Prasinocladus_malaysianus.AAC.1
MVKRSLEGFEATLGLHHTSTMDAVNNLGTLLMDKGDLKGAELMLRWALKGRESTLGPTHTSTLDTVASLGDLMNKKGDKQGADEIHGRAKEWRVSLAPVEEPTCFPQHEGESGIRSWESYIGQVRAYTNQKTTRVAFHVE